MTRSGTVVNAKLSTQDVGRMIGAKRDKSGGQWFPSDFNYSPQTGDLLRVPITGLDSTWVSPFGSCALADITRPLAGGASQTGAPLTPASSNGRVEGATNADSTLPALGAGRYRFLVHKFDVASPSLIAMDLDHGSLFLLLPESKIWIPLEPSGESLAKGLKNSRGWRMEVLWRMEVIEGAVSATLYFPTVNGLAAVTPNLIGLSYAVEHFGDGPALGGPVAWAGEVWLPTLGKNSVVNLIGKPRGAARPVVLSTTVPAPKNGFEAPVFDSVQVIWPSVEGQLILRQDQDGKEQTDWIGWPDGLRPMFSLGCPHRSASGSFSQLCSSPENNSLGYVQMGKLRLERTANGAQATGHDGDQKEQRNEGEPWIEPVPDGASSVFIGHLESEPKRAAIGLRIDAPQGVADLLKSEEEHRAALQFQAENRPGVLFGTLTLTRPWLTSLFVYDGYLWAFHPELSQALGWKLESRVE